MLEPVLISRGGNVAEKAVIIGLFAGLLGSAGVIWAKMPPRPEIHFSSVGRNTTEPVTPASATATSVQRTTKADQPNVRVIPIDRPQDVELPSWARRHPTLQAPKEVMPDTSRNNIRTPVVRPRQVRSRSPGGAIRSHCRPCMVLPPGSTVRLPDPNNPFNQ